LNPASVMKLVTTYAGLELLGPAYAWKTEAYASGPLRDGVLEGDLVLKGYGDPRLGYEQFWLLLRQLRAKGLREIRGDLVLDRSHFTAVAHDPARFDNEPLRPYNVGPDALLLNFKSVSCEEQRWNIAVQDHPQFVLGVFRQLWTELGGTFTGDVRDGPVPAEARAVGVLPSPTLAEVVRDINKFSNNVMARQLFLTLGMESGKRPAGAADADAAIRAWLDARGLAVPELVLENGSGLSRRERISAEGLGRVLQAAWRSAVMPELIASLPVTATDGTMRKRLKQNGVAGQAHIKTGSLEGVRSIAGYVLDKSGRRWIVVFFVNHAGAGGAQAAQDALLQWVYERSAG
jgi:D-alanyl-D-alanine carboxypeptidase/D-alanyl-D-alanine-endopeptidase (penicillin-binding protein 4)